MANAAQYWDVRGPRLPLLTSSDKPEKIAIVVADALTHSYDLESATYFNGQHYQDRICSIVGDGVKIYYFWAQDAGATVDKTATGSGATVAALIPADTIKDEMPAGRYLIMQLSAAGTVYINIAQGTK